MHARLVELPAVTEGTGGFPLSTPYRILRNRIASYCIIIVPYFSQIRNTPGR